MAMAISRGGESRIHGVCVLRTSVDGAKQCGTKVKTFFCFLWGFENHRLATTKVWLEIHCGAVGLRKSHRSPQVFLY